MTTAPDDTQLDAAATVTLDWLRATLESGADTVAEQAPLLFQEVTVYGRFYETAMLGTCLFAVVAGYFMLRAACRYSKKIHAREDEPVTEAENVVEILAMLFSVGVIFGGGVTGMTQTSDTLLAWTAPRLYFIERLMEVVQ